MLVFIVFLLMIGLVFFRQQQFWLLRARSIYDWTIDSSGLLMQGVAVPFLQTGILYYLLSSSLPQYQGILTLAPVWALLLNLVVIDYLYYWNHRLLHSKALWPLHIVHHTVEQLDVFVTSRNTLWTPFFVLYLWVNALCIYLLSDPSYFILGISITAALDLWRHSEFAPNSESQIFKILSKVIITPHQHAWHHSCNRTDVNYGANFCLWDKLHGTYCSKHDYPAQLGVQTGLNFAQKLFFPFQSSDRGPQ